jgi:hypothetical protein
MSATRSSEQRMPVSGYILMTSSESSLTRRADHASARAQRPWPKDNVASHLVAHPRVAMGVGARRYDQRSLATDGSEGAALP